jgi:hypothetical protein
MMHGITHQVSLEVEDARVNGMYVPEADQDGILGFDVMFKKPIMVKQNDDVRIFADIHGPHTFYGTNALSSVTNEGITVTVDCPSDPYDSMLQEQFHEIILSIIC